MVSSKGLYVEVLIRADIESVWQATQDTEQHPRWDARFSRITRSADLDDGGYRFRYERSAPGHVIVGFGMSIGEKHRADGTRTSALRFDTDDRLSPLRAGRGYWRYIPTSDGVRFITGYDYTPGFGRGVDLVLRPVVLWLTAWSFDRLRIWLEEGVPPESWPLVSVIAFWKRGRPKASRCITRVPVGGALADAPPTLADLEAP
ncbi:MAG: SRPBCC family protein [Lacisediminihabitans sp.]